MHDKTSANTAPSRSFTMEDFKRLERDVSTMAPLKWSLISPDGRVWQDDNPKALMMVLARAVYSEDLLAVPKAAEN